MKSTHGAVLSKKTTVAQVHRRVNNSSQLGTTASQTKAFHIYISYIVFLSKYIIIRPNRSCRIRANVGCIPAKGNGLSSVDLIGTVKEKLTL